ncbi:VanZ family protein [Nonlabens antarcticus]|uniref:hypothetical protein n=1 Tax=Nonlabens antarcticus TaxID=392714 RepID=UPI001890EC33|nr:hypothetical protein [Nonlabens antarcticus]
MRKLLYWLAPFYTLVVAYGSLADSPPLPDVSYLYADKLYHGLAYAIMMGLWYLFFYHRFLERQLHFEYNIITILSEWSNTIAVAAGAFSLVIGGLIEIGQEYFSQYRTMDGYDMMANLAGIIIASIILWIISRIISKR